MFATRRLRMSDLNSGSGPTLHLDQTSQLSVACCEYFNVNAMFVQSSVNPAVWILGHIVPAHCSQVFEKYGQGLGMVTMEGREAKHIFLKSLVKTQPTKTDG